MGMGYRDRSRGIDPDMKFYTVMPSKWTFESDKIKEWVESHLEGRVLNACAGKVKLSHDDEVVRNDLNPEMEADYHEDVCSISDLFERRSFDTVVFDPPFSRNQAEKQYSGLQPEDWKAAIDEFNELLGGGGKIIQLGFTATCVSRAQPYRKVEVAVFNTLGRQNDWIGTVDKKINDNIDQY